MCYDDDVDDDIYDDVGEDDDEDHADYDYYDDDNDADEDDGNDVDVIFITMIRVLYMEDICAIERLFFKTKNDKFIF